VTDSQLLEEMLAALRQMDTNMQQGFKTLASAIGAVAIKVEHLELSNSRELRVIDSTIRNMDTRITERLASVDEKLVDIREHVERIEDRLLK
jgi:uncharacterized protein YqeY